MKINVLTSFKLNLEDGIREFVQGVHDVEDYIAAHWYVQAHSEVVGKPKAPKVEEKADADKKAAADASEKQAAALLKAK